MDLEITVSQGHIPPRHRPPSPPSRRREPWEYQTAHIEPSTLIPMNEIPGRAHQELDEEAPILVLCHHGARSLSVANWLRQQGFEKAQSIAGGIDAWSAQIDPTIPRY